MFCGPRAGWDLDGDEPITAFGERLVVFEIEVASDNDNDADEQEQVA